MRNMKNIDHFFELITLQLGGVIINIIIIWSKSLFKILEEKRKKFKSISTQTKRNRGRGGIHKHSMRKSLGLLDRVYDNLR